MVRLISVTLTLAAVVFSTAAFAQTRTTPVEVQNSPTVKIDPASSSIKAEQYGPWQVGIEGTPNVNIVNTPAVKIDSTQNTVTTATKRNTVTLWSTNQTLDPGATASSAYISCAGYKELRVVLYTPSKYGDGNLIEINVRFETPGGGMILVGKGNFDTPTTSLTTNANFVQSGNMAYLSIPVLSDRAMVEVVNKRTTATTITANSWVYLVN